MSAIDELKKFISETSEEIKAIVLSRDTVKQILEEIAELESDLRRAEAQIMSLE